MEWILVFISVEQIYLLFLPYLTVTLVTKKFILQDKPFVKSLVEIFSYEAIKHMLSHGYGYIQSIYRGISNFFSTETDYHVYAKYLFFREYTNDLDAIKNSLSSKVEVLLAPEKNIQTSLNYLSYITYWFSMLFQFIATYFINRMNLNFIPTLFYKNISKLLVFTISGVQFFIDSVNKEYIIFCENSLEKNPNLINIVKIVDEPNNEHAIVQLENIIKNLAFTTHKKNNVPLFLIDYGKAILYLKNGQFYAAQNILLKLRNSTNIINFDQYIDFIKKINPNNNQFFTNLYKIRSIKNKINFLLGYINYHTGEYKKSREYLKLTNSSVCRAFYTAASFLAEENFDAALSSVENGLIINYSTEVLQLLHEIIKSGQPTSDTYSTGLHRMLALHLYNSNHDTLNQTETKLPFAYCSSKYITPEYSTQRVNNNILIYDSNNSIEDFLMACCRNRFNGLPILQRMGSLVDIICTRANTDTYADNLRRNYTDFLISKKYYENAIKIVSTISNKTQNDFYKLGISFLNTGSNENAYKYCNMSLLNDDSKFCLYRAADNLNLTSIAQQYKPFSKCGFCSCPSLSSNNYPVASQGLDINDTLEHIIGSDSNPMSLDCP